MTSKTFPSEPATEPMSYRELLDEAKARQPKRCPQCGDDSDLAPTFASDTEWSCGACDYVWSAAR